MASNSAEKELYEGELDSAAELALCTNPLPPFVSFLRVLCYAYTLEMEGTKEGP